MVVLKFVAYIFMAYGLTEMLVYSNGPFHIFEKMRGLAANIHPYLGELLDCMLCTSTWVGFFFSCLNLFLFTKTPFTPFNIIFDGTGYDIFTVVLDMLFTSGVVWILSKIDLFLSVQTGIEVEEVENAEDRGTTEH